MNLRDRLASDIRLLHPLGHSGWKIGRIPVPIPFDPFARREPIPFEDPGPEMKKRKRSTVAKESSGDEISASSGEDTDAFASSSEDIFASSSEDAFASSSSSKEDSSG